MASKKFALTAEMIDAVSARFRLLGEPARLRLFDCRAFRSGVVLTRYAVG